MRSELLLLSELKVDIKESKLVSDLFDEELELYLDGVIRGKSFKLYVLVGIVGFKCCRDD